MPNMYILLIIIGWCILGLIGSIILQCSFRLLDERAIIINGDSLLASICGPLLLALSLIFLVMNFVLSLNINIVLAKPRPRGK